MKIKSKLVILACFILIAGCGKKDDIQTKAQTIQETAQVHQIDRDDTENKNSAYELVESKQEKKNSAPTDTDEGNIRDRNANAGNTGLSAADRVNLDNILNDITEETDAKQ